MTVSLNASAKAGPAEMETEQVDLLSQIQLRFNAIREAIEIKVFDDNGLELDEEDDPGSIDHILNVDIDPGDFDFATTAQKQGAFEDWLEDVLDQGLLESLSRDDVAAGRHYTAPYMDSSYNQGLTWANRQMEQVGLDVGDSTVDVITQLPQHEDALETIYTRAYSQLEGVSQGADQEISRILSNGMAEGAGPRRMADALKQGATNIEGKRANAFARTEVMNAHAMAGSTRYQEMGVSLVSIVTHQPCPMCEAFAADDPYTPEEAAAALPIHPNCVCSMTPYIEN